jgi:hypothetical protein
LRANLTSGTSAVATADISRERMRNSPAWIALRAVQDRVDQAMRVGGSGQNMMAMPRTICGQNISPKSAVRG